MLNTIWLYTILVLLVGCGSSSTTTENNANDLNKNSLEWTSVPEKYNPIIEIEEFSTHGVETIEFSLFGAHRDSRVIYSNNLSIGQGTLRLYKVSYGKTYVSSLQLRDKGSILNFQHLGQYRCTIKIENSQITNLDGSCYVRIEVVLPLNAEIEVYNSGKLISKRFKAMSNELFIDALNDASFADDKFAVIDDFLSSYIAVNKTPSFSADQLEDVLSEFMRSKNQFEALRKLHSFVFDRENLGKTIDNAFSYYDRDEARKIVGI